MAGHSLPRCALLCRVTLAPCPEHPDGRAGRGSESVAPLRPDGRRDAALWHGTRAAPPG
ncbi:hypothetical protein FOHLNKBM_3299 [Methylobacterium longum]|jgi:hypothetical protein|uniref:hypothetical protein n=1 Tax=Methylobacterium sp. E-046 TaxID=2836576 RepID=UPI001FB98CD9|nr:hypothetical protein [Methylobacterium sp. E-046]MCJ2102873.1 hypothetical protein [Methylobacterium sp. E-046]GJE12252.1 hypothetical protein FOHLNKBM_3299 [Methylobacterium longum]